MESQQPVDDSSKKDEENNEKKGNIRLKQLKQFRVVSCMVCHDSTSNNLSRDI